jgi:hypothetical protein
MGVDIDDLRDRNRSIHSSWWSWRTTVELVRTLRIFDNQRLDMLSDGFGEFTEAEAKQLAQGLEREILPGLKQNQRVLLNGTVTESPDEGTFYREPNEQHENYSVQYEWLVKFVEFSKASGGLYVC